MNEFLLLKKVNLYKRLITVQSIIVRDLVEKKICNKRMNIIIEIVNIKEMLFAILYVTTSIKVDIILDNDILNLSNNKIELYLYRRIM